MVERNRPTLHLKLCQQTKPADQYSATNLFTIIWYLYLRQSLPPFLHSSRMKREMTVHLLIQFRQSFWPCLAMTFDSHFYQFPWFLIWQLITENLGIQSILPAAFTCVRSVIYTVPVVFHHKQQLVSCALFTKKKSTANFYYYYAYPVSVLRILKRQNGTGWITTKTNNTSILAGLTKWDPTQQLSLN